MVDIRELIKKNQQRWDAMTLLPSRKGGVQIRANVIFQNKARFLTAADLLRSKGYAQPPWWFIGIAAEREAGVPHCFECQLAQGDPLGKVSTHEPAGRGPFFGPDAFDRSCLDALIDCPPHAALWHDWTPGGVATIFEEYNGLGYAGRGVPSAYVWSGSDLYVSGKYIADHVYRASAVDVQEGCMPLLKALEAYDPTITTSFMTSVPAGPLAPPLLPKTLPQLPHVTVATPPSPHPSIWEILLNTLKAL